MKVTIKWVAEVALFIIAALAVVLNAFAGSIIPLAYGHNCGWFAIPNAVVDVFCAIYVAFALIDKFRELNK